MRKNKYLVVIGHPDKKSFCYNGIFKTIIRTFDKYMKSNEEYKIIDLYEDKLHRDKTEMIQDYKNSVTWATHLYFISPVWWFRLTPKTETFFDEVFTPGFAYNFVPIIGTYAFPKPMLPVVTLYLNSVKLRLVMGVYTFVFGWNLNRWRKTKQFWSVPFVDAKKRAKYLSIVKKDIRKDLNL